MIGVVRAQNLPAESGAGRSPSATTAAAPPAVPVVMLLLIGVVGFASHRPANTVFNAGVQHYVRQWFVKLFRKSDG